MAGYRTTQAPNFQNFGGINTKASLVTLSETEASDITNFNIGPGGELTRRNGCVLQHAFGTPVQWFGSVVTTAGTEYFVAVVNNHIYEATSPSGTWTDRTGVAVTITESTKPWIGVSWLGKIVLFNGTDKPIVYTPNSNVQTLETYATLSAPSSVAVATTGTIAAVAGSKNYGFLISAVTARGETGYSSGAVVSTDRDITLVDAENYVTVSWAAVENAQSYKIYRSKNVFETGFYPVASDDWCLVTELPSSSLLYNYLYDGYDTATCAGYTNTALNTPADWDTNGQPQGGIVVGLGREERMFVWRDNICWASALASMQDWFTSGSAFAFSFSGGQDNNIKAAASLHDLTVFFSRTNGFYYSGSGVADWSLTRLTDVGCISQQSIVPVGGELYLWAWYGPTTLRRILAGADVSATSLSTSVQTLVFGASRANWGHICGYYDPSTSRVVWSYPAGGATNNSCLVYQMDVQGWTKYDAWNSRFAKVDSTGAVYALFEDGNLMRLDTGTTDNGSAITATYITPWFDLRSWNPKKKIPYVDVTVDNQGGSYTVGVAYSWEYGAGPSESITLAYDSGTTACTTNSLTVDKSQRGTFANIHRIYTKGMGRAFRLTFTASTASQTVKCLGWRPQAVLVGSRN
jgi:hypothetical protein